MSSVVMIVKSLSPIDRNLFFEFPRYHSEYATIKRAVHGPSLLASKANVKRLKKRKIRA